MDEDPLSIVNPASGIANDYLNLFNEIIMLVEQLPTMPDLVDDVFAWRPVAYEDYFERSQLDGRQSALDAYRKLDSSFRSKFETAVRDLDIAATASLVTIRRHLRQKGDTAPQTLASHCERCGRQMREALERAISLVNHGVADAYDNAQMRADRLLAIRLNHLRDLEDFYEAPRFAPED